MTTVSDLMSTDVRTLYPESKMAEAWKLMHDHRIRHIPICKGDKLVGLVTQKDLLVNAQNQSLLSLPVAEVMVFSLDTTTSTEDSASAAGKMLEKKISCLPVVDDDKLVGILTDSDFLQVIAAGS